MPTKSPETLYPAHELFIAEMIAHGNRRIAYQKAYPGVANASARTAAARLITDPYIAGSIQKGLLEIKQNTLETIRKEYEGRLTDIEEKRAILAQIIRGEISTEKEINKKGETQTIKSKVEPKDRIKAILLDNKMEEEWNKILNIPDEGMRYVE